MEANSISQSIKTFSLTVDEPHLSSTRNGVSISYQAGDQIIVCQTKNPAPGSLVLVQIENKNRLCRYENISGDQHLFPPLGIDPARYQEVIRGQVIDRVRISKWLSSEK